MAECKLSMQNVILTFFKGRKIGVSIKLSKQVVTTNYERERLFAGIRLLPSMEAIFFSIQMPF